LFLICNWGLKKALLLGRSVPNVLKNLVMGQSIWLIKKKRVRAPLNILININHNTLCVPQFVTY
jgi:hypothetical protein